MRPCLAGLTHVIHCLFFIVEFAIGIDDIASDGEGKVADTVVNGECQETVSSNIWVRSINYEYLRTIVKTLYQTREIKEL